MFIKLDFCILKMQSFILFIPNFNNIIKFALF